MKNRAISLFFLFFLSCLFASGCHSGKNNPVNEIPQEQRISPRGWFNAGVAWNKSGDHDRAIESYNKAVDSDPLYTSAYFYRAGTWEQKGMTDKAIADYTRVIKLNPELENAYSRRGNVWQVKGNLDRAIADYTKILKLNPRDADAYHNRGNAWGRKGNYKKAVADFNRALKLNPDNPSVYDNRGNAWSRRKNYARAIADYKKALETDPNFVVSYNNLAWLLATCPKRKYRSGKKALELARKAVKLNPDASTLDTLAAAYAELGKFDEAVSTVERIIRVLKERGEPEKKLETFRLHLKSYKARKPWRMKRK